MQMNENAFSRATGDTDRPNKTFFILTTLW